MSNITFKKVDVSAGMTLAVYGDKFVSKAIEDFEHLKYPDREGLSHIVSLIDDEGKIMCCEMLEKGCTITPWEETEYFRNEVKYMVLGPAIPWVKQQIDALSELGKKYCYKVTRYKFLNFVNHIVYIVMIKLRLKPVWLIHTGDKRQNCSMLGAILFNEGWKVLHKDIPYRDPEEVDPNGYVMCGYQKLLIKIIIYHENSKRYKFKWSDKFYRSIDRDKYRWLNTHISR
jgi:hypothetical protein